MGLLHKLNRFNLVDVSPGVAITKKVHNLDFTHINKTKVNNIEKIFLKNQITLNLIRSSVMTKNNEISMIKSVRCHPAVSNNLNYSMRTECRFDLLSPTGTFFNTPFAYHRYGKTFAFNYVQRYLVFHRATL